MTINRREFGVAALTGATVALAGATATAQVASPAGTKPAKPAGPSRPPRCRVVVVNDIAGDPDGLFALAHALLSPAAEVRCFVGGGGDDEKQSPKHSVEAAAKIVELLNLPSQVPLHEGLIERFKDPRQPPRSPGVQAIIDEAMRDDTDVPLFVTVGGALTEIASALAIEPRIAKRLTLIWIGGRPHSVGGADEFNFSLDPAAVRFVFNESEVPIWQVPSDAYMSCVVSMDELKLHVAPMGGIGAWLYERTMAVANSLPFNTGDTWTLGDSPLVVLTALTTWFPSNPRPLRFEHTGGSAFEEKFTPRISVDGAYEPRQGGRKMRVYNSIDVRTMQSDLFAKLKLNYGS